MWLACYSAVSTRSLCHEQMMHLQLPCFIVTHRLLGKTLLLFLWPVAEYLLCQSPVLKLPSSIESAFKKIMVRGAREGQEVHSVLFGLRQPCLFVEMKCSLRGYHLQMFTLLFAFVWCDRCESFGLGSDSRAPGKWIQQFEPVSHMHRRFLQFFIVHLPHTYNVHTVFFSSTAEEEWK